MNSKTTGIWFALAAALFAFIFIFQHYFGAPANAVNAILPGLQPSSVTSIQVFPAGALEIRADFTNDSWMLTQPVSYPAQPAAIESLLAALQKLAPATRISAGELSGNKNSEAEFGFDSPQSTLIINVGDQSWQLKVGNKTAPGDQVYLRVVGVDSAFVADAGWLKLLPHSANDWRSTALVDADVNEFDSIVLTNGAKVIELRRDPTNRLWRMIRPLQARADTARITEALQRLQTAHVTQFVTDDPKADLTLFGLQPADLDLWLGHGTNFTTGIHAGKSPPDDPTQIYAKREGWDAIVTVPADSLSPWHGTVNDFRDPHLLELTAPVAEIEVTDGTNGFTLQRQGTNGWRVVGDNFPVDTESVQEFLKTLAGLNVARFVEDVATAPDLPKYGLATPQRQITLRSAIGDTNAVIAQLQFGTNQNDEVFVRRADEASTSIYAITAEDFNRVDEAGWEFRTRQIWNFTPNDVAEITLHQDGKTRQIIRNGPDKWSLAPGSQGIIEGKYMEQSAQQLGGLTAFGWVGRNITEPERYGLNTNNLQIVVELKNSQKLSVDFGAQISNQTALAATTLDGQRWAFIFPPGPYLFVLSYLTIPADVP
ncbi:MAG TPA: DUF4340 domain-containing protein [Candidatus Baltobacteraceae bacterium]|nr:DUF4340 domain-containing protein [Candidatus Baltobacteraceae bacterium]